MTKAFRIAPLLSAGLLFALATTVHAVPVNGLIESNAGQFSVVHTGANPSGSGDPSTDWYWFDDNQSFSFDLTGGIVSTNGLQSYQLYAGSGDTMTFDIVSLYMDTNGSNGFAGGEMQYRIDGGNVRSFTFTDSQYGNSPFNSSSFDGMNFEAFVWGGDIGAELGIDFAFRGIMSQIPEPTTLALFGLGLMGLLARRRAQR